jgi:transposase
VKNHKEILMKKNILKQGFGIDISKDSFAVQYGMLTQGLSVEYGAKRTFKNTLKGIESFLAWVDLQAQTDSVSIIFVVEATGVYYENLAYILSDSDLQVSVLLPNKAKAFAASLDIKSKTDELDATMLCRMGLERNLPVWQAPDTTLREIKLLTRERGQYQKKKTKATNQLHAYRSSFEVPNIIIERLEQEIKFLMDTIGAIEEQLALLVSKQEGLQQSVDRITKVPGLGMISVLTVLAETNNFALVKNIKQLVSYAGLDVQLNQSGKSNKKSKISKKGNSHIRKALYMPALSACGCKNTALHEFYERVIEKKAAKKIGVIAVERKLLILIYSLWKSGEDFDRNRYQKQKTTSGNAELSVPLSGTSERKNKSEPEPALN